VKAAFWLFRSEADQWYLYIVSDEVNQKGRTEAYMLANAARRKLTDLRIGSFEVKLIPADDPIAKAILKFLSELHSRIPTRIRGANLGGVYIEEAYICPIR
jgi:hypothetical protein